jgi:DNA-binding NarL/FixJ family response regulator
MRIALVDEDLLLIDALQRLMARKAGMNEVKIYTSGKEFLEAGGDPPQILVTGLSVLAPDGNELLESARASFSNELKIIVFSPVIDVYSIKNIIRRGANGIVSKSASFEEFEESIREVKEGKQYIDKALRETLINSVFTDEQLVLHLSPREKEVLQKVCGGQTIKEIAYDLKLSVHTVQYYHRSVMDKFKVKRTTDLIVFAIQHRLYIPENK